MTMSSITPGTGATIQVGILEKMLVALLRFGQRQELEAARNPNTINNISSGSSDDTLIFTANVTFPCNVVIDSSGKADITATDYLTGVTYSPGTDGTLKSINWVAAVIETTILAKNKEISTATNPTGQNNISWTVNSGIPNSSNNAIFTASYNMPLIVTQNPNGSQVTEGAEYLT